MNDIPGLATPKTFLHTLRDGGTVQVRVVGALVLREMQTRYGRENIGYLWALVEPLMLILMLWGLFYWHGRAAHAGMNMVSFLATGIMAFISLRKIVSSISSATDANQGLLLYPQVTPIDTMLARIILESATFIVVFAAIIGGGWLLDVATLPDDLFGVIMALFAISLLSVSLGLLQGAVLTIFPPVKKLLTPFWRMLFFASCVFYTLADLPLGAQAVVQYNPIAHAIELLRVAYFSNFRSPIQDYWYIFQWSAACIFTGLLIERMYRYRDIET